MATKAPDRAEAMTDLLEANRQAKRQPCAIGTEDYPSRWDQWHEWIDLLLDDVLASPA